MKKNIVKLTKITNINEMVNKTHDVGVFVDVESISVYEPMLNGTKLIFHNGTEMMVRENIDTIQNKKTKQVLHG